MGLAVGSGWTTQTLMADPDSDVGRYISLAIDGLGRMFVVFQDVAEQQLRYMYHTGTSAIEGGYLDAVYSGQASVAIGPDGQLHVAYFDLSWMDLKHATNDIWVKESLFPGERPG